MSKQQGSFGKSLSGSINFGGAVIGSLADSVANVLATSSTVFNNIIVTSGTIDGVTLGSNQPGPVIATQIISGTPSGEGYKVCFFGQTVGDSICWDPVLGRENILGDLLVRDISDLGNLRVSGNVLSSTNTNGDIILNPNGTGKVVINQGITQTTTTGDITFNTDSGGFGVSSSANNNFSSGRSTSIITKNGDIILKTGVVVPVSSINFITTGSNPRITTTIANSFVVGTIVSVSNTNCYPQLVGTFTVLAIFSTTTFSITSPVVITLAGTSGNVSPHNDIYLSATDSVHIPNNVKLNIGKTSELFSDGVGTFFNTKTGQLEFSGNSVLFKNNLVGVQSPVISLGGITATGSSSGIDKGITLFHNSKTAFFGRKASTNCFIYIPDSVSNSGIITGAAGCAEFGSLTATSLNLQGGSVTGIGSVNSQSITTCNINCNNNLVVSGSTSISLNTPVVNTSNVTVSGTTNLNNLNVTGLVTGIGFNTEHLSSASGGIVSPSSNVNTTFITITSSGTSTGTLSVPSKDGFSKFIFTGSLAVGAVYKLFCPTGTLLDPGSGTAISKTLTFSSSGQSIHLMFDSVLNCYLIVNAGCCIE